MVKKLIKLFCCVALLTTCIIGLSSCSNNNVSNNISSREMFNEKNREDFFELKSSYDEMKEERKSNTSLLALSTSSVEECDYEEVDMLFELGFNVLDMIEAQADENDIMEYFVGNLTEDQQNELINTLNSTMDNISTIDQTSSTVSSNSSQVVPLGWHTTHVVIAMSYGYIGGSIASYLIGWATGYIFAHFGASMGIVGTIISGVVGYIVGSWVETKVNNWVESGGYISGFRWEITSFKVWWFWGSSDNDVNLVDLLFYIIGKTGGQMGYGARPESVPQPTLNFA